MNPESVSDYQYDVFISYKSEDRIFAASLEKEIENFVIPRTGQTAARNLRAFRYEGEMYGAEYYASIEKHLKASHKLLVVCSPETRKSEYVNHEIRTFAGFNKPENVISLLLRGYPNNDANAHDEELKAFPEELCKIHKMPLAKDYRNYDVKKHKISKSPYETAWFSLLADLLDKPVDEVTQKEIRRKLRRRNQLVTFFGVLSVILLTVALIIFAQSNDIEAQSILIIQANDSLKLKNTNISKQKINLDTAYNKLVKANAETRRNRDSAVHHAVRADSNANRADRNARRAIESDSIARREARTANVERDKAKKSQKEAERERNETARMNKLLDAENRALQSIAIVDIDTPTFESKSMAYQAFKNYKGARKTISDISKGKIIYEALYKNKPVEIKLFYEPKVIGVIRDQIYSFGNNLRNKMVRLEYSHVGINGPFSGDTILSKSLASTDAGLFQYLAGNKFFLSITDDLIAFSKLDGFEKISSLPIEQGNYRNAAFEPSNNTLAIAGRHKFIMYYNLAGLPNNVMPRKIPTSDDVAGLFFFQQTLFIVESSGKISTLNDEGLKLRTQPDGLTKTATTVACVDNTGNIYAGNEKGEIHELTAQSGYQNDIRYIGKTRVEILQVDDACKYLLASFADKTVCIFEMKYFGEEGYLPWVINDLPAKPRALVVTENFLFISLANGTIRRFDLDLDRLADEVNGDLKRTQNLSKR